MACVAFIIIIIVIHACNRTTFSLWKKPITCLWCMNTNRKLERVWNAFIIYMETNVKIYILNVCIRHFFKLYSCYFFLFILHLIFCQEIFSFFFFCFFLCVFCVLLIQVNFVQYLLLCMEPMYFFFLFFSSFLFHLGMCIFCDWCYVTVTLCGLW